MKNILACLFFLMAGVVYGQESSILDINMTNENGQVVKTGFALSCKIEKIGKADKIKDPLTKKAIKETCDIIDAMNKEDMKRLGELSYSQKEVDFYKGILQFQKVTYKSDDVEFMFQIKLADKRLIFYKAFMENNNMKIPLIPFTLLCEKDDKFVFVLPNEVESVLTTLISQSIANPIHKDDPDNPRSGIRQGLKISQNSTAPNNDCQLLFNGIPVRGVDVSTYNEPQKNDPDFVHGPAIVNEIITWFKSSLNDMKNKTTVEYADLYYTNKSKKTFISSLARMQKEGLEIYRKRICDGGYVIHYIIDASPYYIVFYTQKDNKLEPSEKKTKKFNYVFCVRENQKLKFTNYLKSNTFFDALIKKNILDIDLTIERHNGIF